LHFAQSNRRLRHPAVRVEHGILRIFPALLRQSLGGALLVLHETRSIAIAVRVDPLQSALDVWPNLLHERQISRALEVSSRKHDEKRRRVDAAVIAPERNFLRDGHFTAPHFMQDFARVGVLLGYFSRRLGLGQVFQDALSDTR